MKTKIEEIKWKIAQLHLFSTPINLDEYCTTRSETAHLIRNCDKWDHLQCAFVLIIDGVVPSDL